MYFSPYILQYCNLASQIMHHWVNTLKYGVNSITLSPMQTRASALSCHLQQLWVNSKIGISPNKRRLVLNEWHVKFFPWIVDRSKISNEPNCKPVSKIFWRLCTLCARKIFWQVTHIYMWQYERNRIYNIECLWKLWYVNTHIKQIPTNLIQFVYFL